MTGDTQRGAATQSSEPVNEIAARLQASLGGSWQTWAEALLADCAETYETVHQPPLAGDGLVSRSDARTMVSTRAVDILKALPDFRQDGTVSVDANRITVSLSATATLADGTRWPADVILWATGFRPAVSHLAPLRLRSPHGGIQLDGTTAVADPRVQLVGYGPSASTIGANRAGRVAARGVAAWLDGASEAAS